MIEYESFASTKPEELSGIVGKHFIYTYDNGWLYEFYVKNDRTVDYRLHTGILGGRWVRDQKAHIVRLAEGIYKISWEEPTGICVSLAFLTEARKVHGAIFFPNWITTDPGKIICYQNDHLDKMRTYRDAGPTHPRYIVDVFATIRFMEDCGADNESVIACAPSELPAGYASRQN